MKKITDLFKRFKRDEEEKEIRLPKIGNGPAKVVAIVNHKKRISNLNEELMQLSRRLENIESDFEMTKNEREKASDNIVRRLTLIEYEINIREGLIKWLS